MRFIALVVLAFFNSLLFAQVTIKVPTTKQVELSKQAIVALKEKNHDAYQSALSELGQHPLQAYFDYYSLLYRLPDAAPEEIKAYQQKYPDLHLSNTLYATALDKYGRTQNWQSFLSLRSTLPYNLGLKCYYWRAQYELGDSDVSALKGVPDIWLTGQSLPTSCDALFVYARQHEVLTDELLWKRLLLAFAQHNAGLVRHLSAAVKEPYIEQAEFVNKLLSDPLHIFFLSSDWSTEQQNMLKKHAVLLQAQKDATAALYLLNKIIDQLGPLDPKSQQEVSRKIAWFNVIRNDQEQREWTDAWLESDGDAELFQQRIRLAVREQNWPETLHWINALSDSQQQDPHWLYWRARALQELGHKKEAKEHYQQAASHRSFWGFLAADRVNTSYALNTSQPLQPEVPKSISFLERIHWLMAVEESSFARAEWNAFLKQNSAERIAFMQYAKEQGWYGLVLDAAGLLGDRNALAWRFPLSYQQEFEQVTDNQHDPLLYMAVARRESAFHPHVESRAGAVGLIQLMPTTAAQVAHWRQEEMPIKKQLKKSEVSIRLGASYLNHLLERFNDNRLLALAAYNAGPHNVEKWLGSKNMAYDVWVESIPFYETREYVQAVLSYRVLFEANQTQKTALKKRLLSKQEQRTNYQQDLLK